MKLAVLLLFIFGLTGGVKEDKTFWRNIAQKELEDAKSYTWNHNRAHNVILFIGDGMSPDTITASRIYRAGEESYLAWEKFPHIGLLKTYNTDKQAPDSASTATALFSGVKTNYNVHGVDANVKINDCEASYNADHRLDSIIDWAQAADKSTGFVTTTRVTHATPAPLYAHGANRKWECETPKGSICKDIARQLVENEPGKNIKVIMGGGRQMLQTRFNVTNIDPLDIWAGQRKDGRDLIDYWIQDKKNRSLSYNVVQNNEQLASVDLINTDYLLGIFANGHIPMDYMRDKSGKGQPSLEEMTVEGGLIDFAHHRGHAAQALLETVRLSDAVNATLRMVNPENTLVIVTSDHTHSLAFNGNSKRGNSVLGIAEYSKIDGIPYTTLSYSTGGPNNNAYTIVKNDKNESFAQRLNFEKLQSNTEDFTYSQQAAIITDEAHHGGGDVAVYARGPYAHLFHTTHEQNFVAYVIAYAARIGPYANHSSTSQWNFIWLGSLLSLIRTFYAY
ncbi:alkaline phosphatase isoform X2 [Phymastichus coffea]|uniref:alkaline phosphatase isoform X2 n=1 Tax=Phymastichus coffea TaxID=108790 RepID=UPI00273CEBC5|nr:alkaline phosphatase isoform X2 [Phymastichus coffea]